MGTRMVSTERVEIPGAETLLSLRAWPSPQGHQERTEGISEAPSHQRHFLGGKLQGQIRALPTRVPYSPVSLE